MSMNSRYRRISPRLAARLKEIPSLTRAIVDAAAPGTTPEDAMLPPAMRQMIASMPAEARDSMLARMKAQLESMGFGSHFSDAAASARDALAASGFGPQDVGDELAIEKAWHGLHYLLAGTRWEITAPPGNVILGGTEVGGDLGYGPGRLFSVTEVSEASLVLAELDLPSFRLRYKPAELKAAEIYGGAWDDPQELEYLEDAFTRLRQYFIDAAISGHAVLTYLV